MHFVIFWSWKLITNHSSILVKETTNCCKLQVSHFLARFITSTWFLFLLVAISIFISLHPLKGYLDKTQGMENCFYTNNFASHPILIFLSICKLKALFLYSLFNLFDHLISVYILATEHRLLNSQFACTIRIIHTNRVDLSHICL